MINGMTIETYVPTYNEIVIFPYYYQHYSQFCDKIVVLDNDSTDGTQELVVKMGKEGSVPTELRYFDTNCQTDQVELTNVRNNCWKGSKADWVIVCDCDEMLWDWENLKNYKPNNIAIKPKGYHMLGDIDMEKDSIWDIKQGQRMTLFDKMILFNPTITDMNYTIGSHFANPQPPATVIEDMRLLHYSWINEDFIINKHRQYAERFGDNDRKCGWAAYYLWDEDEMRKIYRERLKIGKKIL